MYCEIMRLGKDLFINKFDEIDAKINTLLDDCYALRNENNELKLKIEENKKEHFTDDTVQANGSRKMVQAGVIKLISKLNQLSDPKLI